MFNVAKRCDLLKGPFIGLCVNNNIISILYCMLYWSEKQWKSTTVRSMTKENKQGGRLPPSLVYWKQVDPMLSCVCRMTTICRTKEYFTARFFWTWTLRTHWLSSSTTRSGTLAFDSIPNIYLHTMIQRIPCLFAKFRLDHQWRWIMPWTCIGSFLLTGIIQISCHESYSVSVGLEWNTDSVIQIYHLATAVGGTLQITTPLWIGV